MVTGDDRIDKSLKNKGQDVLEVLVNVTETSTLIQQAKALLGNFDSLSGRHPDTGWELVAELQEVLDRMREIWPPRTFMPPGGWVNPKAPSR